MITLRAPFDTSGVAIRDVPSSLPELRRSSPRRRGVSLFTFAAPFGSFKLAVAWSTSGAALAIAKRGGLVKAPESRREGEGIRGAASEDCCNFMAPLAASETRAGEERLRRLKLDVPHDRRASRGGGGVARSRKSSTVPRRSDMETVRDSRPQNSSGRDATC